MRIWLVKLDEPLRIDEGDPRPCRMGLIADALHRRGHEVLWWTSTEYHQLKRQRFTRDTRITVDDDYVLWLMHARPYRKNISIGRMLHHRTLARKFLDIGQREQRPDLILCALPSLDMCQAAVKYGRSRGVPVVLDIRDLWPDIFPALLPRWARPLSKIACLPFLRMVRMACAGATGICGITPGFVAWGLGYAQRRASEWDASFFRGYPSRMPDAEAVAKAADFWERLDVTTKCDGFRVCVIGALGERNEREVLAAIATARRLPAVQFVFCGTGTNEAKYRESAADAKNAIFAGWCGQAELWTLMRYASVGLVPFQDTIDFRLSISNRAIEYLSAGLPIVSSAKGVLEDLLASSGCGVTYANGSAEDLCRTLSGLMNSPDKLRGMSVRAAKVFQDLFRAEVVYEAMADHLESVAMAHTAGVDAAYA